MLGVAQSIVAKKLKAERDGGRHRVQEHVHDHLKMWQQLHEHRLNVSLILFNFGYFLVDFW